MFNSKKFFFATIFAFVFLFIFSQNVFAEILEEDPKEVDDGEFNTNSSDVDNPGQGGTNLGNYPGTSIKVRAGDVLYSGKKPDTFFVGHVGIVGTDGKVRHIIPSGKKTHTLSSFKSNFGNITVLRHSNSGTGYLAATKSREIYSSMSEYKLNNRLNNVKKNYCTKFVWQSFYQSSNIDILGLHYTGNSKALIFPSDIRNHSDLNTVGSY